MSLAWSRALAEFEVAPGLIVSIPKRGQTNREHQGGWLVVEAGGLVTISDCPDLDRPNEKARKVHGFALPEYASSSDPVELARDLVKKSFELIFKEGDNFEALDIEGSVQLRARLIEESPAPEQVLAGIADTLKEWAGHFIQPVKFDLDVELVSSVADNESVMQNLVAAADHFQASILDVARSADPVATRVRLLPSLVAVPYSHACMPGSFRDRFHALLMTFEAAVRYLAVVSLSPMPGDRTQAFGQLAELGRTPTLGIYLQTVRKRFDRVRTVLPQVGAALQERRGKWTALGKFVFQELAEIRNRLGAHGGVMADAAYVEPSQMLSEKLEELLMPLARDGHSAVLVVQQRVEVGQGESAYDYRLIELRGDSVGFSVARHSTSQKLESRTVYLLHGNDFVDVDPLVVYSVCPRCNFDEAFFLDHFDPKSPQCFSFRGGHRISLP